jgi:hypothetical protein
MKRRRMARRRTALISRSQRPPSGHRRLHLAFLWSEIRGSDGAAGEGQSVHPPDRAITGPIRAGVHEGLHDYQSGILWSAYPIKLWAFGPPSVSSSDAEKAPETRPPEARDHPERLTRRRSEGSLQFIVKMVI